jgi:serine/threonine protein kinase
VLAKPVAECDAAISRFCARHPEEDAAALRDAVASALRERAAGAAKVARSSPARHPAQIGPFHILSELGSGGMGAVYLAAQKTPVQRRVALKVIKLGMDTKGVLARFEAERQALAMLDHPNIARMFEAGATPEGRPYFAMEYVKGVPLTRYCDDNKLSIDDRLTLFRQVCSGVQHAHTKGVIHRDLTPNNVLVTSQDGIATAKIIDFGLARATDHRLTQKTVFTEQGVILGTPEYMSPEQAGLDALDVDMRTDVYTLGVLLYELLTGALPFSRQQLRQARSSHLPNCRASRASRPMRRRRSPAKRSTSTASRSGK